MGPHTAEYLAGADALARGAWTEARETFEASLLAGESPEALEGLALAAWWLDLAEIVFDARERAYRLYLSRSQPVDASRVAVWLAWDCWAFRGETAVANGWLQRARRLLDGQPPCAERAWLEIREGSLCLFEEGDPERAQALAAEAVSVAKQVGSVDLEMLGRSVQGMALVAGGSVADGMRILDEVNAAVVAGELHDLVAIGMSCCYTIAACERVRDYDRALQWVARLKAFSAKWGLRALFAVCRTQYASICVWRGTWLEAEEELRAASDELMASRPAMTCDAIVRLAELRRRQGRIVEATELFDQSSAHPLALLGRAELAFDRGDQQAAAEQAARYLRHVPMQNRTDRASGLDVLVRSLTDAGDWEGAETALAELTTIASIVSTVPLRAAASFASGYVAVGQGRFDAARQAFEDAVDLFVKCSAPFEVGRSRVQLARALGALGRVEAASEEIRHAIGALSPLKAELEIARARTILDSIVAAPQPAAAADGTQTQLTKRELEVLRLVAEGLSNQTIAERLFLSDHTVHRHLANILSKLSVSTRAAAVAQAARRGLLA
jgi:DNA-binding NarL/FixJ family response regulator